MKHVFSFLLIACCLTGFLHAQQTPVDSAQIVIDRYLGLLNFDEMKTDSMLYIETIIVGRNHPNDTTVMKRWFVAPNQYRVEIWMRNALGYGLVTDGRNVFRKYNFKKEYWENISASDYYDDAPAYDFHGPLYRWKTDGGNVEYQGEWNYNGHPAYRIFVQSPIRYDRNYLFEKESGLLFLVHEFSTHAETMTEGPHVDWRAVHEYQPFGRCLFPSVESYQYKEEIVFQYHTYKYLPINLELFQK